MKLYMLEEKWITSGRRMLTEAECIMEKAIKERIEDDLTVKLTLKCTNKVGPRISQLVCNKLEKIENVPISEFEEHFGHVFLMKVFQKAEKTRGAGYFR